MGLATTGDPHTGVLGRFDDLSQEIFIHDYNNKAQLAVVEDSECQGGNQESRQFNVLGKKERAALRSAR